MFRMCSVGFFFFFAKTSLYYTHSLLELEVEGKDACLEIFQKALLYTYTLPCACRIVYVPHNTYFWKIHILILHLFAK